jgi:hypothetical protein
MLIYNGTTWVIPNAPAQNPTGLELITTCTVTSGGTASNGVVTVGSTVSSVVIANAFSSTYDNYKIVVSNVDFSIASGNWARFQLSASANHYSVITAFAWGSTTQANSQNSANTAGSFISLQDTSNRTFSSFDVFGPNKAEFTYWQGTWAGDNNTGTLNGYHDLATAYTGFTIAAVGAGGTMTGGTIRVYGYRNS